MKIKYLALFVCVFIIQCNKKKEQPSVAEFENKTVKVQKSEPILPPELQKGKDLINNSNCRSCHDQNNRFVGPSYLEIAKKYGISEERANLLADKIINGGSGVWGEVPMQPHPQTSKEDAKKMALFILNANK